MVADVKPFDRIIGALALVSILVFNMWYIHHVEGNSARRQCTLINAQVRVYDEDPPSTSTGQGLAEAYRTLKSENHC